MATTLTVGQIAIIAVNTEDNGNPQRDLINILLLAPLDAGTVIYLTDRAWNGTAFAAAGFGDGTFTYTVPGGGLPAGSVLTITQAQLNTAGFSLSDFAETIYLYQGANANAPTTFLHAIDIADENISSNGSLLNTGLTYGTSAVSIGPDNAEFATRTWDIQRGDLFSAINTASHWAQNVNSPQDGTATGSPTNVAPDAQIWVAGAGAGNAIVTINLDGTYNSGNVGYQISQAFQNDTTLHHPSDITLDTVHDRYFFVDSDASGHNRILQGSISQVLNTPGGPLFTTVLYTNPGSGADGVINSLSVDTSNGIIYFDVGTDANGSTFNKIVANTANQTPTVLATLGAEQYVTQVAIDYTHGTVLLAVSEIFANFGSDAIFQNYVYRATGLTASSGTNSLTFTQLPFSPDDTGMGGEGEPLPGEAFPVELGNVRGIDIDPVTQIAYIVTGSASLDNDGDGATSYLGGVYSYALTGNSTGVYTTLYHQNGSTGPLGLLYYVEVDHATGKYYVIDENGTNADPGDGGVYVGSLTAPGTPTLLATVGNINGLGPRGLEIQHASVLSGSALLATFTEAVGAGTTGVAIAPAGSFQATDSDSGGDPNSDELAGAQVRISAGFQTGATHQDVLTINGATSGSVAQGNGDSIAFSYNATTGVLTLTGVSTLDNYEAVLGLVRFRADGDNPTLYGANTARTISYATFDGLLYSDEVNASVTVTGTNDAPINVVPGGVTITEDANPGRVFSTANGNALSVSDADADPATQPLQVTLTVDHGTLTLASTAGLSFSVGDGTGDTSMTFTGTANAINAALGAGLTYTGTLDYFGADSLSIVTGDQGNTGTGGATSDTDSVSITINGVADIANDNLTINEDAPAANVFVQLNDMFENSDHAITAITQGLHGTVSINNAGTPGTAADDYLVYTADADYFGIDTFTYKVTSGGATETAPVTVNVNAVNDAPTATATGANPTYVENASAVTPFSGFTVNAGPNEGTQLFTQLKLTVTNVESGHDALTIGPNTLTLTDGNSSVANGIIATVSLVGTTATVTFTSPGTSAALLQGLINTMGYRYDGEDPSSADRVITITSLTDNGGVNNGGVDTALLSIASTVHVTPVNDAPVNIVGGATMLDEDAQNTSLTGISVSDADADPQTDLVKIVLSVEHGAITLRTDIASGVTAAEITAGANGSATIEITATQNQINATLAAAAGLTYTPTADYNGADGLTVVTDDLGNNGTDPGLTGGVASEADTDIKTIAITAINDAPDGADKSVAIDEDTTYTFGLSDFPTTDLENDGLQAVKITTLPANGTLLLNGSAVSTGDLISQSDIAAGKLTFVPAPDANGAGYGSFTFQVQDDGGVANGGVDLDQTPNTFTINVDAVNDAPVNTVPGVQSVNEDQTLIVNGLSVGDVDAGAAPLTVTLTVSHGALTLSGVAGLSFAVNDGTADRTMTFSGTQADINVALAGLIYAPDADYHGADLLDIVTSDGGANGSGGTMSDIDSVAITVNSVNDAPAGADTVVITTEDVPYAFATVDFGFSDTIDNDNFAGVVIAGLPGAGALLLSGVAVSAGDFVTAAQIQAGALTFAAEADASGYASFTFQVRDDGGVANGGVDQDPSANVITIAINPVVDIADDSVTVTEDSGAKTLDLLGNDSFENANRAIIAVGAAAHGIAAIDDKGTLSTADDVVTYTANADYNGADSFTYTVFSGNITETATVNVTVTAVADIADDIATAVEDTALDILVQANDSFEAVAHAITAAGPAAHGTVTINDSGTLSTFDDYIVYTADADYNGTDSFTYTVTSGGVDEIATVNVTVGAVADIADDTATTAEDAPRNILVLANDTFESGDYAITAVGSASHGSVLLLTNGTADTTDDSLVYTADADYNGTDSFTYTVTSGGVSETATVNVTVTAIADIAADTMTVDEDSGPTPLDLLANDSFEDTKGAAITAVSAAAHGSVTINDNGTAGLLSDDYVVYTADADYNGVDSFTYTVTSGGVTETATVSVTVNSVNDAPKGANGGATIAEDSSYLFTAGDFGFSDKDGDAPLAVVLTTVPPRGRVIFDDGVNPAMTLAAGASVSFADIQAGHLSFVPDANANDTARLTFQVQDDGGTLNGGVDIDPTPNIFRIIVTPVDDAPVAINDRNITTAENKRISIAVIANDRDVDGGAKAVTAVNGVGLNAAGDFVILASGAKVTLAADGSLSYDPNHRFDYLISADLARRTGAFNSEATDSFTYTLNGGSTATVKVDVSGVTSAGDELRGNGRDNVITLYGNPILVDGGAGVDTLIITPARSFAPDPGEIVNFERILVRDGATLDLSALAGPVGTIRTAAVAAAGLSVTGSQGDDYILGRLGHDTLLGAGGDDHILLSATPDRVDGGSGFDRVIIRSGDIVLTDANFSGVESIRVKDGATLDLSGVTTPLVNIRGASVAGGGVQIVGTQARDHIVAGKGDDILTGGQGDDVLTGGKGDDIFRFTDIGDFGQTTRDRITDFRPNHDTIDLSVIDPAGAIGGDQAFTFIGGAAFTGSDGTDFEVRFEHVGGGNLLVQGDIDHDGSADFSFLVHAPTLHASDFVL